MRGKIFLGLSVLIVLAVFATIKYRQSLDVLATNETPVHEAPTGMSAAEMIDRTVATEPASGDTATAPGVAAPSDPQFQQWIREEAKSLDSINVDGEKKQAEIDAIVKKISPSQARQLKQTVLHPRSATREKILSAYLLVQGGMNTRDELKSTITAPLREKGGDVHSQAELDGVREKSVRIMLIDGLFAQAQNDPQARQTLAQTIVDSADPYIKSYAQEKFDQLPKQ